MLCFRLNICGAVANKYGLFEADYDRFDPSLWKFFADSFRSDQYAVSTSSSDWLPTRSARSETVSSVASAEKMQSGKL